MENLTGSSTMFDGYTTAPPYLPLRLSTHNNIPSVLIRELAITWMIIGMLLNGLLIYYLVWTKKYRSPVFMLVLFLASNDCAVCLSMACMAAFLYPVYIFSEHTWLVCKIVHYLIDASGSIGPYYLVLFAALRFYQLCFPLKARVRVTSSFVRNWCLVILLVETVGWSPHLFSFNLIEVNIDNRRSVACLYTGNLMTLRNMSYLVVNTCIPAISISMLHLLKYIGVARTAKTIEAQQERKNTDIRALMIVIAMFYTAWVPINVYGIVYKYLPNHGPYQDKVWLLLMYINSSSNVVNPFVYCLAANSVRNDIANLLCKKKHDKRKHNPS